MRQKLIIGFLFFLAVICAALVPLTIYAADEEVEIPIKCNERVCMLPREALMALMAAHNEHVEQLKNCVPFKKERDA